MIKTRKSVKKRILSVLLVAILFVGTVPLGALAEDTIEYYGRTALADMPNSTALLYAYDQIVAGVGKAETEISVYNGTNAISKEEISTVIDAYRRDHTEHFWFGNSYSFKYTSSTVTSLKPSYTMSGTVLETAKEKFNNAVNEFLFGITPTMSEYEREKLLHDRLAAKTTYQTTTNAHNAYGAIVEGKAVCEGYAEAYQYLLQRVGLQSFIAIGSSINPTTNSSEGHAWNIVRVNGNYYHVDLTWNDQDNSLFYAYFNKTDAYITEDHTILKPAYALPVCNSDLADYFTVNNGKMETFDAKALGEMLKNGGLTARVYVTGNKTDFIESLQENIFTLATETGVTGAYSCGYNNLGREYIITIFFPGNSGNVTWGLYNTTLSIAGQGNMENYGVTGGPWGTNIKNVIVYKGVTNIGSGAFYNCSKLEKIELPNTVTSIGSFAFQNCKNLKSITISDSIITIGEKAFAECSKDLVIYGKIGSTVQKYAKENNIKFVCRQHGGDIYIDGEKSPTCTKEGYTGDTKCKDCNAIVLYGKTVSAIGHEYKTTTTKATFSKNGSTVKICETCGESSTTAINKVSSVKLSAISFTYTGKAIKPSVAVKNSKGKTLKNGTDYTVTYSKGLKEVGKYSVKITLKGDYSGTKTLYFTVNPKGTTVKSVSGAKKSLTVKWNKQSTKTTGYQIQYSTNAKFKSAKTVTVSSNKTTSKTISKLTGGKKYYVRVRTYKTVGKTKYYSDWSSKKSVTVKK